MSNRNSGLPGLLSPGRLATGLLLLTNSAIFLAVILSRNATYVALAEKTLPGLVAGQWWRLITAGYLHVAPTHIIMNMWSLYVLGPLAEEIYGTRRMFTIYTVGTITGFLFSAVWTPNPSLGASAGICGLLGGLIAVGVLSRSAQAKALQRQLLINTAILFIVGMLPSFPIDNAAHLGGIVGGFAVAYLAGFPRPTDDGREKLWAITAIVSLGLTLLAFWEVVNLYSAVNLRF